MENKVIYLDKNNTVVCWGDSITCKNYINQMYSNSIEDLIVEDYSTCERYSSFYEDYEVFNVRGTNVYLTLGEIKMLKEGCQEETRGIKYIEKELEHLTELTDVFNSDIISELHYMKDYMKRLINIYSKYNMENLFVNLDIDALHSAYQMERENKGLPVIFIR